MKTTHSSADLLVQVGRQAKRLGDYFDLKLSHSQEVLAKTFYQCAHWQDLRFRLKNPQADDWRIQLLAVSAQSLEAQEYICAHLAELAHALSQHLLTTTDLLGLYDIVKRTFGLSGPPTTIGDIVPCIKASDWKPAGIGQEATAIIEATTAINGVPLRLIGTRVYRPEYYRFGEEVTIPAEHAAPYRGSFRIVWSKPDAWYNAAYQYLLMLQEEDDDGSVIVPDIESLFPEEEMDERMLAHQGWFERMAETWQLSLCYEGEDPFHPVVIPEFRGCYIVFGIPAEFPDDITHSASNNIRLTGESANDSLLIQLAGQPACIEWISVDQSIGVHDGLYPEHFETLSGGLLSHPDCDLKAFPRNGWHSSYFFITPATDFDIRQAVKIEFEAEPGKEAFAFRTDNPMIAATVIGKVANRDLRTQASAEQSEHYVMEIDVSAYAEEEAGFSLSLVGLGTHWETHKHFIPSAYLSIDGDRKHLYLQVSASLLRLVELIPKKELIEAVQCGWILHQPNGFSELLSQPPKRLSNIKLALQTVIDLFRKPLRFPDDNLPLSGNVFKHMKPIKYTRGNR